MKKFLMILVASIMFFGTAFALDQYHSEQFYTVKIFNTCGASGVKCYDFYDKLVKDGILAFCIKDSNACVHMTQIMAGMYETAAEAKVAADIMSAAYKVKCVVGETYDITTTLYKKQFSIINTPSGIWRCENRKYSRVFDYGKGFGGRSESVENPVSISPAGNEIVFYFKGMIYKEDLTTEKAIILVNSGRQGLELKKSSPQWSYDGKYIAFLDKLAFNSGTCLRVVNNEGNELKYLHDNTGKNEAVMSFKLDPSKAVVYFVEVFDQRQVPIGGKLLVAGLNGIGKTLVESENNSDVDRHFRIEGKKLIYSKNTYSHFDHSQYSSEEHDITLN